MASSPAERALLAVLRPQPDPVYPLAAVEGLGAGEGGELAGLLRAHGLEGWAHARLRQAGARLPAGLGEALERAHTRTVAAAILALDGFARVSRELSAAGVEHVPLKGARLLRELYPDPGTRAVSDLDVLVRLEDLDRADRALRGLGLEADSPREQDRMDRFAHHRHYVMPGPVRITVELHVKLSSTYGLGVRPAALWEGAEPARGPEATALERRLAPLVELHWLLVHVANHGYGLALKWLLDLRLLLEREGVDGAALLRMARASGTVGACGFALALLARLAGSADAAALWQRFGPAAGPLRWPALELLGRPAAFFGRAAALRAKWPAYGLLVFLADGPVEQARVAARTVGFKAHLEGLIR